MKRTLSLLCIPFAVYSQKNVFIQGRLPELANQVVLLEDAHHLKEPIRIDAKGNFTFSAKLDSGYYTIDKDIQLFLGPGTSLRLTGTLGALNIQGAGEIENKATVQISHLIKKFFPTTAGHLEKQFNSLEPEEFLQIVYDFKLQAQLVLESKTLGSRFVKSQKDHLDYTIKYFINDYLKRYGIDPDKENEYYKLAESVKPGAEFAEILLPAMKAIYVRRLPAEKTVELQAMVWENFDINKADLYSFSPYYRSLVFNRLESLRTAELIKAPYLKSRSPYELRSDIVKREFADGPIKEELLFQNTIQLINGSLNDEKTLNEYLSVAKEGYYREQVLRKYEKLKLVAAGCEAPQFAYKDQNNQTVSLSTFKGNYVYLDIWASWCGPCKLEVPYLKDLEKRYQNQNVKFVNISVDLQAERHKWLKFIKEQNLGGIQLMADKDFRSDFIQAFSINTIPRFILINPEGKIVSTNAPRPSNPKLQEMLDKLLLTNLSTCATCAKNQ